MLFIRTKLRFALLGSTLAAIRGFRGKRSDVHLKDLTDIDFSLIPKPTVTPHCCLLPSPAHLYMPHLFTRVMSTVFFFVFFIYLFFFLLYATFLCDSILASLCTYFLFRFYFLVSFSAFFKLACRFVFVILIVF